MAAPSSSRARRWCAAHGGQAQPTAPNPRVTLAGQPSIVTSAPWTVAGCTLPPASGGPCVTAQWTSGTVRVTSVGQPLVVADRFRDLRSRPACRCRSSLTQVAGDGVMTAGLDGLHVLASRCALDGRGHTALGDDERLRPRTRRTGAVHPARASG